MARDRAIAAYPEDDYLSRVARLNRFVGALQALVPDVAAELVKVLDHIPAGPRA